MNNRNIDRDEFIGSIFADRYEILDMIGTGGMSKVYKARQQFIDKIVAIKILNLRAANEENSFERFVREAKTASSLKHKNIIETYDFGVNNNSVAFLIMEYIEGKSLGSLLNDSGFIPYDKAVSLFIQICDGMQHAHSKLIIHRDLKPNNILVVNENNQLNVKIFDFGIAKFLKDSEMGPDLTQKGDVFGSPLYMSPEQCKGENLTPSSDIYSLGCVLFETLTGYPPFRGNSNYDIMSKHVSDICPLMSTIAPHILFPQELENLVAKMLEKNIENRPSSMEVVKETLHDIIKPKIKSQDNLVVSNETPVNANPVVDKPINNLKRHDSTHTRINLISLQNQNKFLMVFVIAIMAILLYSLTFSGAINNYVPLYKRFYWQMLISTGNLFENLNNYDAAEKCFNAAIQYSDSFDDRSSQKFDSLLILRELYKKTNPDSKVVNNIRQKILESYEKRVESFYHNIKKDDDEPIVIVINQENLPKHPTAVMVREFCNRLSNDAKNELKLGHYDVALGFLDQAIPAQYHRLITESTKSNILNIANQLAMYLKKNHIQSHEAIHVFERALEICNFKESSELKPGIELNNYLANYYFNMQKYEKALNFSKTAVQLTKNISETSELYIDTHKLYIKIVEKTSKSSE